MAGAIFAGLLLILIGFSPAGKGLVLGTLFSVINFVLMGQMLPLKFGRSKPRAFWLSLGTMFGRYVILAVPLLIALKLESFHLYTTILGLFMVQIAIMADHLPLKVRSRRSKRP